VNIERIAIENREQWLKLRKRDVTASAISALIGENDFLSPFKLWALKSGLVEEESDEPKIEEDAITLSPMARGLHYEDSAALLARRLRPHWEIWKCEHYYRDPAARIGASPDFLVNDPDKGLGNLQIKHPNPFSVRNEWKQPDGSFIPPIGYAVQTIVEAALTGATWAAIGLLVNEAHTTTFRIVDVPLDSSVAIMERLTKEVRVFWTRVKHNDPPPPDFSRDGDAIRSLYARGGGTPIDLTTHNRIGSLCEEKLTWTKRRSNAEAALDTIDAEIADILGNAEEAIHPEFKITRKLQKRKAYSVPESETRVLRVTRKKEKEQAE
jgi:hypothetical protein